MGDKLRRKGITMRCPNCRGHLGGNYVFEGLMVEEQIMECPTCKKDFLIRSTFVWDVEVETFTMEDKI